MLFYYPCLLVNARKMNTQILDTVEFSKKPRLYRALLLCGVLSSVYYILLNVFVPFGFDGYSHLEHTVSELSAIDAPTRPMWVSLATLYVMLFAAFGWGVFKLSKGSRSLRITGILILVYSAFNFYWPPMHLRGDEKSLTDVLHIAWASITILMMMVLMGFGAAALGSTFRKYTIITFVLFMAFGILTGIESPNIAANLPTPWIGLWERINIGLFMLWIIVFSIEIRRQLR